MLTAVIDVVDDARSRHRCAIRVRSRLCGLDRHRLARGFDRRQTATGPHLQARRPTLAAYPDRAESGHAVGQYVVIEYRWAGAQIDLLPALAMELARRNVDVFAALGTVAAARAANEAARPTASPSSTMALSRTPPRCA